MRKTINILIFTIAGVTAILTLLFSFLFNQETIDKFYYILEIKDNNPKMIADLKNVTVGSLPDLILEYERMITNRNDELKEQKIQRNIFNTFIFHLSEITNQETFINFKNNFPEYSKSMFVLADNTDYFVSGFNKVNSYVDFLPYFNKLKAEYENVKKSYLKKASLLRAETNLLKQVRDINASTSVTKKQNDLNELVYNISAYQAGVAKINSFMNLTYLLLLISIFTVLFFLIWNVVVNFRSSIGLLAGFCVLVLLLITGYFTSSSDLSPVAVKVQESANSVKWIGAGLFTFYCVFFGTLAAIIFTLIHSSIKNSK